MSDDAPKSAFEIAMEKLRAQDRQSGEGTPATLTAKQKEKIAACRNKAEAQLAELEILFRSTRAAAADPEALQKAEEEYARERRRVEERRDGEIARIRSGKKGR